MTVISIWMPASGSQICSSYIEGLIAAAPCRAVLQFNRVDFRLEWLRHYFPSAVLIHLYRHPREQWCSTFLDGSSFPPTGTVAEFEPHDHFYLLAWARDLAYQFPFLDPQIARHPYELFYLIWKLSWIFGTRYTDASLCYETLCERPQRELLRLMRVAHVTAYDLGALQALIGSVSPPRWPAYASPEWFEEHEARAEEILLRALGADSASPNPDDVNVRGIDAAAGYPVGRVPPDVWAVAPQGSRQR